MGTWNQTTSFPVAGTSCTAYAGYAYCVDGQYSYYGQLTLSGIASWTATTSYPDTVDADQTCAASAGYIYCVGGTPTSGGSAPSDYAYYATATASGIGAWIETSDYPTFITGVSCVISAGYIYCAGGETGDGTLQTGFAAYAPVSSSGIGTWTTTTTYPHQVVSPNCVTSSRYIYCAGGMGVVESAPKIRPLTPPSPPRE